MVHELYKLLLEIFRKFDFSSGMAKPLAALAVMLSVLFVAWLAFVIVRYILNHWVVKLVQKTRTEWDDILVKNKVFNALSHLVPLFILYSSCNFATPVLEKPLAELAPEVAAQLQADYYFFLGPLLMTFAKVYFVFTIVYIIVRALNAANGIYMTTPYCQ